jgi:hypothetical protein
MNFRRYKRPQEMYDDPVVYDVDLRTKHNVFPGFSRNDNNTDFTNSLHEMKQGFTTTYDSNFRAPEKEAAIEEFFTTREQSIRNEAAYGGDHLEHGPSGLTLGFGRPEFRCANINAVEAEEMAKIEYDPSFSRHRIFLGELNKRQAIMNSPRKILQTIDVAVNTNDQYDNLQKQDKNLENVRQEKKREQPLRHFTTTYRETY